MYFVDDSQAKRSNNIGGEFTVVHCLNHPKNDVLVYRIAYLALNATDTCRRDELGHALYPLIEQEFFVYKNQCFCPHNGYNFQCHDGVVRNGKITQEEPPVGGRFQFKPVIGKSRTIRRLDLFHQNIVK